MKTKANKNSQSEEGRKILYRLLLLAVAVVYALVFVLDYMLQLHFTFFLLLSLFGFVILTLFYMWFRIWNTGMKSGKDQDEDDEKEILKEVPISPAPLTQSVFDDAVFIVNSATGLTMDCSDAAVNMFEAVSRDRLLGIDLNELFDPSWKQEDRMKIKNNLKLAGKADVTGVFRSVKHKVFEGRLQAVRIQEGTEQAINVRITETPEGFQPVFTEKEKSDWFEDAGFPMAIIGLNYGFIKVNPAFSNLTGYNFDELKRMSMLDLIHPEDRLQEKKILSGLFRGELKITQREKRMVKRNNEIIWVSTSGSVSTDKDEHPKFVITMTENITQRKRVERILADNKNKLNSLVENAEYSTVTVDRRHTIMLINSKLSNLLFTHTGIIVETGFNLLDILPEVFHKEYLDLHKKGFNGEQFVLEKTFTINRKKTIVEIVITPVREESGLIRTISIFGHDITSKKKNVDELVKAKEEAQAATEAKSGFLATMSHEIRTPLNGVIGMGRLLNQTQLSPKQQEFVDSILLSGDALLSVINDILDFSKIESSKMELEHKPFAIKRCIEETFDLLSSKAIEKNLSLHFSIAREVPSFIFGDITRLRQILMNLVSNAIKFTQKGIITIAVSSVRTEGKKLELRFDVVDTGVGIPADKINRLFKSFSQADAGTAKMYGGSGLGLAICKNLVELMGGKIWVESTEGTGSDFIFTIVTEPVAKEEIPKGQKNGSNRLANSYVLIVSDDKAEAALYADYFKRWGMIPQIAEAAGKSVDIIKQRKDYNLIMIDAQLISEKPLLIAEEIRSIYAKEELPIVLFNTMKTDDIFFDYTSEVISAVIPKNIDRSKVLDILISVFSIEEHQRTRDEHVMKGIGEKLGDEVPAKILIAEDNLINQKLAQNIFEGIGYKPVIVSNGLEVIDQLRKQPFDIIFMDVQMPEMDGFETTKFIINKLVLAKRPVIVAMTAFALEGDKEKCLEVGMNDYISKPFLVEEIVARIRKWIPSKINNMAQKPSVNEAAPQMLNMNTIKRLREIMGASDPTFFKQVMTMFINQGSDQIIEITQAVTSSDIDKIGSVAHKLKGSALNIGAEAMAETCRTMELKARVKDSEGMQALVKKLAEEFDGTKREIEEMIK